MNDDTPTKPSGLAADTEAHSPVAQFHAMALAACGELSQMPKIETIQTADAHTLMGVLENIYIKSGDKHDTTYGNLDLLMGIGMLQEFNPSFSPAPRSQAMQLSVACLQTRVVTELTRILGKAYVTNAAGGTQTKIKGLAMTALTPTASEIYHSLRKKYLAANAETRGELDKTIHQPLATSSIDETLRSLREIAAAMQMRAMTGSPLSDQEQFDIVMHAVQGLPALSAFYTYAVTVSCATKTTRTVATVITALEAFALADPRLDAALKKDSHHVANVSTTATAQRSRSVSPQAARSSKARGDGTGSTGRSATTEPSTKHLSDTTTDRALREQAKKGIRVEITELARTAKGPFCRWCVADGHAVRDCNSLQSALKASATPPPDTSKRLDRRRRGSQGKSP